MKNDGYSLNVFTYGYYNWKHPIHNIRVFFRNIRRAWQRATKGYCDWDVWDLDTFYQELMIHSLERLRDTCNGYPNDFNDMDEWKDTLSEIINCLKEGRLCSHESNYNSFTEYDEWFKEETSFREFEQENLQKGLALLSKYWNALWD